MLDKIHSHTHYQITLFLISLFFVFTSINLFYLSSEAPDYIFYKDYFDYFFRETPTTGKKMVYYIFLVSCVVKLKNLTLLQQRNCIILVIL